MKKFFLAFFFFLLPSSCFAVGEVVLSKDTLVYSFSVLGSYVSSRYTYVGYAYMNSASCTGAMEFLGTYDTLSYSSVDSCSILYSDSITNSKYQTITYFDYAPPSFTLNCQDVGGGYYGLPLFHETIRSCVLLSFTLFQVDSTLCSSTSSDSSECSLSADSLYTFDQYVTKTSSEVIWSSLWLLLGAFSGILFWGCIVWFVLKY